MTIHSYYYQKPSILNIMPKINTRFSVKKIKRSGANYVEGFDKISTKKKIFLAGFIGLFVFIAGGYIYSLSTLTNLDYQIYSLKEQILTYEKENAELKSQMVRNISPESIANWAESNGFVKNETFSSFEVKNSIIAANINSF